MTFPISIINMPEQTLKRGRSGSQADMPSPKRVMHEACTPSTKPVRFLIMSDTHDIGLPSDLPECDVLLHCGDLTECGTPSSISDSLQALSQVKAELKLVIAGNHEISLDKKYWLGEGGSEADVGEAHALISPEPESKASRSRVTFLSEGTYRFTLSSGATFRVFASPYTPGSGTSAFQYPSNEDRFNFAGSAPAWAKNVGTATSIIPDNVNIFMTHGPPKYILDATANGESAGCEHLRRAVERVKPRLHCFGHIHKSYGAQRLEFGVETEKEDDSDSIIPIGKEFVGPTQAKKKGYSSLPPGANEDFQASKQTLCINAAMEGEKGILENAPWLVDLNLPIAKSHEDLQASP